MGSSKVPHFFSTWKESKIGQNGAGICWLLYFTALEKTSGREMQHLTQLRLKLILFNLILFPKSDFDFCSSLEKNQKEWWSYNFEYEGPKSFLFDPFALNWHFSFLSRLSNKVPQSPKWNPSDKNGPLATFGGSPAKQGRS